MAAQDCIIEALHGAIKLKLELSSVLLVQLLRCFHRAHLGYPGLQHFEALVVRGQIWIVLEGLLHIAKGRQQLVDHSDVKCKDVHWGNEFSSDIEDALRQVPICLLTTVVGGASLEQTLGGLAMLDIVHLHEGVQGESLHTLRTQLVLMVEGAELGVVLRTRHLSRCVREFLKKDQGVSIGCMSRGVKHLRGTRQS